MIITREVIALCMLLLVSCEPSVKYPEGGYDYPAKPNVGDTSFYYYPLKDVMTRRDSFNNAFGHIIYPAFGEPNLSIRPMKKDIFRFFYSSLEDNTVIITLTDGNLIIKTGDSSGMGRPDYSKLTPEEESHLELLNQRFPMEEWYQSRPQFKPYYDSIIRASPQLLDVHYYMTLTNKTYVPSAFRYTTKIIPMNNDVFKELIDEINRSGYWKLPYFIKCNQSITHANAWSLEANTSRQYNLVWVHTCPGDTSAFTKVCQKIVDYAGKGKEIDLIWE